MSQSFGILVPRLAIESPELLYAVLALAAYSLRPTCLSYSENRIESEKYVRISQSYRMRAAEYEGSLHNSLAAILRIVYYFTSNTYDVWTRKFDVDVDALPNLSAHACGTDLLASTYGCLLRMGEWLAIDH